MTPFEFGAWGGSVSSFVPTKWLGTRLNNGTVVNESACVLGFDRGPLVYHPELGASVSNANNYTRFMLGVSAGAFNLWEVEVDSNGTLGSFSKRSSQASTSQLKKREEIISPELADGIVEGFQEALNLTLPEIVYAQIPNPFAGLASSSPYTQTATDLLLVDGPEGGQTIPLWGQIQPARSPAFIIAWDNSGDAPPYSWNNGTNLYNTYLQASASRLPFPIVPPSSTFVNRNYTSRPVFFGCDKKLTTTGDSQSPIVLYLASAPYSAYMNFTASAGQMSPQQMNDIFVNGFNQLTQENGTLDKEWPVCLGCAAIERSLEKAGIETPEQCNECFERYCWNGDSVDTITGSVDLSLVLDPNLGYQKWLEEHLYWNATMSSSAYSTS
jgi:lysophospholipase